MGFNYQQGRRLLEAAKKARTPSRFFEDIGEALQKKELRSEDFSLKQLFRNFVKDGNELLEHLNPMTEGGKVNLRESNVSTADFSNITGQIFYNELLGAFDDPTLIGSRLVDTVPTSLDGERIAGISNLSDDIDSIGEAKPYPRAGVQEDYVDTPKTTKRGLIVPVTKEAIFFDRTGQVLERCRQVSRVMAINKEKRILDCVLGITSSYNRKGRGVVATYGANSGNHDWNNLLTSTALQDYTDIEAAMLLFDAMTDPNTGEPIMLSSTVQIVVPTALQVTLGSILAATQFRKTTNTSNETIGANPLSYMNYSFEPVSNAYVKARTSSADSWWVGDFRRGFKYMENWGPTVVEAPTNSYEEFNFDIVAQFKISERGVAAAVEPRYAVKVTA